MSQSGRIDTQALLIALGDEMAAVGEAVGGPSSAADRRVWHGLAEESQVPVVAGRPASYAQIAAYGGASPVVPVQLVAVQVKVFGRNDFDGGRFAEILYGYLLDDLGAPRREWTVSYDADGAGGSEAVVHRILGLPRLTRPSLIGRTEDRRPQFVFNFDLHVTRVVT